MLEIIKPDKRKDGKRGKQGLPGKQGNAGVNGKDGINGVDGRDGQDGSVWYSGDGKPDASLGVTGDFYLDNDTYDYYEKTTRWVKRGNLKGAKGDKGERGAKGDKGDKGDRGPRGFKGEDGGVGTPGADGAQGPQGPQGMTGAQGDPGVGVPVGGTTGQILAKDTDTDYDTEWIDAPSGAVDSVNGQTGVVTLGASDVGADPAGSAATAETNANNYTDTEIAAIDFPVDSVNGQTDTVVLDTDDVTEGSTNKYYTDERVDDRVDSLLVAGKAIDLDYVDSSNSLTITGHTNQIIYNSSGGVGMLRFNSWSAVITYLALTGADTDIIIEQDETIPAGSYDLKRARFVGNNGLEYTSGGWTVTFGDNTTITAWQTPSVKGCRLLSTSTTGNIFTSSSSYTIQCSATSHVHSTTYPFFKFTGSGQCVASLENNARWQKLGGGCENIEVTSAAFACQLIIFRGGGSSVSNDTLKSTNAVIYVDVMGDAANDATLYPTSNTNLVAGVIVPVNFIYGTTTYHIPATKSADFTYTRAAEVYAVSASGAARTGSLPASSGSGVIYTTVKSDNSANTVTIDAAGSDVINSKTAWGAGNYVLSNQGESVTMVDHAAGFWLVIGVV